MRTKLIISSNAFFLIAFMIPVLALGAENPLLVQLPQKINQSLANIEMIGQEHDQKTEQKENEIKRIVEQIHQVNDEKKIYSLQKEYLALRAEMLKSYASRTVQIENELASIVRNMDRLEKVWGDSQKFGLGPGIEREDISSRKAVKGMLNGFRSMIDMVETLDPDSNLGNMKETFVNMNSMGKSYFTNSGHASLQDQKEFILDVLTLSKSVQGVLGAEHDYLLTRLWYIDSNHIVKQFGKIKMSILGDGINVNQGLQNMHEQDQQVLGLGSDMQAMNNGNYNPGYENADTSW